SCGSHCTFYFSLVLRPPLSTLFPYTTLFRSLLEQAQRIPVAVVDVAQRRLLERGRQRDRHGPLGQVARGAHGGDRRRVHRLLGSELVGRAVTLGGHDLAPGPAPAPRHVLHHEVSGDREHYHEGRPEAEEAAPTSSGRKRRL